MLTGLGKLDDPDGYLELARSLAGGQGFSLEGRPTAYRPPLYPILLAPLIGTIGREGLPWGVAVLHLSLGTATVLLTHRAARGLGLSSGGSLAAAAIVGLDPVLLVQSRSIMTETTAAALVAATLAALTLPGIRGSILGGLGLGLASLCRPSLLAASGFVAIAGSIAGPGSWKVRVGRSTILLGVTAATLSPWAWRNARAIGSPIWTTTHGGYTLALANNPAYYADVLDGELPVWRGPNQDRWFAEVARSTAGMAEPEADRALRSAAARTIRERPVAFLRASAARLGRFWGVAPSGAVYGAGLRLVSAAWTAPLWLAMAVGLLVGPFRRWPGIASPAILLALTSVHFAYWTDLRMRAPVVPAIALIAASAGTAWARIGRDDRSTQPSIWGHHALERRTPKKTRK